MKRYLYYPGCSMEGSGRSYRESINAICEPIGIALDEINDWNCCGATEYVGLRTIPAYAMIARNLAIAANSNGEGPLVAACSACYLNLAKADSLMGARPAFGASVNAALGAGGLHYTPGSVKVRHLLDVIINDVGLDAVRAAVKKPLTGLRVAPYLGCMVPRPDISGVYANHEQPDALDRLLAALGAEVVDYPLRTECCGGHMTQVAPQVGLELIRRLVAQAEASGAALMATVCPMCQINIDAYQGEVNAMFGSHHHMPIVFFTQLMGVAFGINPARVGLGREYTDAKSVITAALQTPTIVPPDGGQTPTLQIRPDKRTLPMPRMPAPGASL